MTNVPRLPFSIAALLGLVASALIGWGSTSNEFSFATSGWPNPVVQALSATIPVPWNRWVIILGCIFVCWLWWNLRPRDEEPPLTGAGWLVALWSLPLLFVPPVLSGDAALYADAGYMAHAGVNVYEHGLTGAGGPYAGYVDALWAGNGVAYPPLSLLINQLVVTLAGFDPYFGVIAMRVPAIVGVVLMGWSAPRIARMAGHDPETATWWALLNPLVLIHFIGGAHNDALMAGVSLLAIWVAVKFHHRWWAIWVLAPVLVGVAMSLKQQAGLTVVAVAGYPILTTLQERSLWPRIWQLGWRTALATVISVTVFVAISVGSGLGFGWTRWMSLMRESATFAPLGVLYHHGGNGVAWAGGDVQIWQGVIAAASSVLILVALAWIVLRWSDRPTHTVGWGGFAVSGLSVAMHPWYFPWSLAVLGLAPLSKRQTTALTVVMIGYLLASAALTTLFPTMPTAS